MPMSCSDLASIASWFRLLDFPELASYIIKSKNTEGLTFDFLFKKPASLAVEINSSSVKTLSRDLFTVIGRVLYTPLYYMHLLNYFFILITIFIIQFNH
jgi:hypothetical protein